MPNSAFQDFWPVSVPHLSVLIMNGDSMSILTQNAYVSLFYSSSSNNNDPQISDDQFRDFL